MIKGEGFWKNVLPEENIYGKLRGNCSTLVVREGNWRIVRSRFENILPKTTLVDKYCTPRSFQALKYIFHILLVRNPYNIGILMLGPF